MLVHRIVRHHIVAIKKNWRAHSINQVTCIQFRVQFIIKFCSCIQLPYAKSFKMSSDGGEGAKKKNGAHKPHIHKVRTTSKSNSKCVMLKLISRSKRLVGRMWKFRVHVRAHAMMVVNLSLGLINGHLFVFAFLLLLHLLTYFSTNNHW